MLLASPRSCRRSAAIAVLALHVCAAIGVLSMHPVAPQQHSPAPIVVRWIAHEPGAPLQPRRVVPEVPPKVKPAPKLPTSVPSQTPTPPIQVASAAATESHAPMDAQTEAPAPEPASAPTAVAANPSTSPTVAAAPELPISPPSFNAGYLHNPSPPYPASARRNGESGRVVLRVLVTVVGTAERVELRTSSGSRRLDSAALETVQRWKFVPARRGETPVAAWVLVPISFSLEG